MADTPGTADRPPVTDVVEQMRAAIERSGYLLEGRVAETMAEAGFDVQPNSFHPDPANSEKGIEIDADCRIPLRIDGNEGMVTARALAECKNNSLPIAVFMRSQRYPQMNSERIRYAGFPSFSMDQETKIQVPLYELLEMKQWHHYCSAQEVATQFCSFTRDDRKGWKTEPMANYTKTFSDLALVAASHFPDDFDLKSQCIQVQLTYPIVVLRGDLYCVHDDGGRAEFTQVESVQLHHSAFVNGGSIAVQIDMVTEAGLPGLIETIKRELRYVRDAIKPLHPRLLNSAIDQKDAAARRPRGALQGTHLL